MSLPFVLTDVRSTEPILMDLKRCGGNDAQKYDSLKNAMIKNFAGVHSSADNLTMISATWFYASMMTCVYALKTIYAQEMLIRLKTMMDLFAQYHTSLLFDIVKPLSSFFPFETFRFVVYYYLDLVYRTIYGVMSIFASVFIQRSFLLQLAFVMLMTVPGLIIDIIISFYIMMAYEVYAIIFKTPRKRVQFFYRFALLYGVIVLIFANTTGNKEREEEVEDFIIKCLGKILY